MQSVVTVPALFLIITGVFALSLIIHAFRKLRVYKFADYLLMIFLGLFLTFLLVLLGKEMTWWDDFSPLIISGLPGMTVLLLGANFYALTVNVFKEHHPGWWWALVSGLLIAAAVVWDLKLFSSISEQAIQLNFLAPERLSSYLIQTAWVGYQILLGINLLQVYRNSESNVVRQRAVYWTSAFILFAGSSILTFRKEYLLAVFLQIFVVLLINYLVLTYRLPDLRIVLLQSSAHLLTGTVIVLLFSIGFLVLERIFTSSTWYEPVFNGAFNFLIVLVLYQPIHRIMKSILQRLIIRERDQTLEIRNYSKKLSSILDIELLSSVTIKLICEALDIQKGTLFLVDQVDDDQGQSDYQLRAVPGTKVTLPDLEYLPARSPIARVLVEDKRPLTQSELECIPKFQTIPENILVWLKALEVEALVPVHTEDEWIGLFALSSKRNGASFTDKELEFLSTVGDQTSVALQNARLVESLTKIDNQLRQVKASKNTALDKIERIKRSTSDVISIKAHELRSALTVMSGYTQLLANTEELMAQDHYAELIRGVLTGLDQLESIIDSMLYSASVKPSNLVIGSRPLSLYSIIDSICRDLQEKVQARKITLSHDNLAEIPAVYGDSSALRKVFRILIVYAMTHTPSGGKIRITGRHIPPRSDILKWEGAEVVVCDTGIGIDPEIQNSFFRELKLEDDLARYLADDMGIDEGKPADQLAVVRGVIEAHNGRVWVERTEKDTEHLPGSEFHVVLPLEQQDFPTQKVES